MLAALATWRVTHLLAEEDGPGHVVFHLRRRLGDSPFGALMDCFNCLSLWIAAAAALFVSTRPLLWAMSWLALSGAACLLATRRCRIDARASDRFCGNSCGLTAEPGIIGANSRAIVTP